MKLNIKSGLKVAGLYFKDHAPEYLTGIGIAGFITTTVLAVRATPKAVDELRKKKPKTVVEEIKIAGKYYVVAIVTGTLSTICLVSSCSVSKRRNAALAAALALSEDNLIEYKDKVKEMFGENKEEKVEEAIAEDHAQKVFKTINPNYIIRTGRADTFTLDLITGQVMLSDIDWIKSRFIDMNSYLQNHETMNVSEYAEILHLEDPQLIGQTLGWVYKHRPTSNGWEYDDDARIQLYDTYTGRDGIPMLVIGHRLPPSYGYDNIYR